MKIALRATPECLAGHGLSTTALYHRPIGVRGGGEAAVPRLKKFQGKFCFQGKRKLLKIPE